MTTQRQRLLRHGPVSGLTSANFADHAIHAFGVLEMLELIVIVGGLFPALGEISRPAVTQVHITKCVDLPSPSVPQNSRRGEFVKLTGTRDAERAPLCKSRRVHHGQSGEQRAPRANAEKGRGTIGVA